MNNYNKTTNTNYSCNSINTSDNKLVQLNHNINQSLSVLQEYHEFTLTTEPQRGDILLFGVATPYPHALPTALGELFFNLPLEYDVRLKETSKCVYNVERHFEIRVCEYGN